MLKIDNLYLIISSCFYNSYSIINKRFKIKKSTICYSFLYIYHK